MLEFVIAQFAGEEPARLVAEFRNALVDELFVHGVISIHSLLF
jgi:hypothetical protein